MKWMRWREISLGRAVVTAVAVGVLLSPLVTARDSFPLSTYPMYASARADTADLVAAVGITESGDITRLSLVVIGKSDDPLIVESRLRLATNSGNADALCRDIAQRVRAANRIEVVTERHRLADIATNPNSPAIDRTVHATCPVEP